MALAKEVAASLKPGVLKNQRVLCVAAVMWVPVCLLRLLIEKHRSDINAEVCKCVYKIYSRDVIFVNFIIFARREF